MMRIIPKIFILVMVVMAVSLVVVDCSATVYDYDETLEYLEASYCTRTDSEWNHYTQAATIGLRIGTIENTNGLRLITAYGDPLHSPGIAAESQKTGVTFDISGVEVGSGTMSSWYDGTTPRLQITIDEWDITGYSGLQFVTMTKLDTFTGPAVFYYAPDQTDVTWSTAGFNAELGGYTAPNSYTAHNWYCTAYYMTNYEYRLYGYEAENLYNVGIERDVSGDLYLSDFTVTSGETTIINQVDQSDNVEVSSFTAPVNIVVKTPSDTKAWAYSWWTDVSYSGLYDITIDKTTAAVYEPVNIEISVSSTAPQLGFIYISYSSGGNDVNEKSFEYDEGIWYQYNDDTEDYDIVTSVFDVYHPSVEYPEEGDSAWMHVALYNTENYGVYTEDFDLTISGLGSGYRTFNIDVLNENGQYIREVGANLYDISTSAWTNSTIQEGYYSGDTFKLKEGIYYHLILEKDGYNSATLSIPPSMSSQTVIMHESSGLGAEWIDVLFDVRDEETRQPISMAAVTMYNDTYTETKFTSSKGTGSFSILANNDYSFEISKAGYYGDAGDINSANSFTYLRYLSTESPYATPTTTAAPETIEEGIEIGLAPWIAYSGDLGNLVFVVFLIGIIWMMVPGRR